MAVLQIGNATINVHPGATAIIFGHSDADGHLATEQSRTNLKRVGVDVKELVVNIGTKGRIFWKDTLHSYDLSGFDLVVVVDIMFDPQKPCESLLHLSKVALEFPGTRFVVVDHHPLAQTNTIPENLSLISVKSVYDCCVGTPTIDLMVVAALCDGDAMSVRRFTTPQLVQRAVGLRRAAADLESMVGTPLLSLIQRRKWSFFEKLAIEPATSHQIVRGKRTSKSLRSPLLEAAKDGII